MDSDNDECGAAAAAAFVGLLERRLGEEGGLRVFLVRVVTLSCGEEEQEDDEDDVDDEEAVEGVKGLCCFFFVLE